MMPHADSILELIELKITPADENELRATKLKQMLTANSGLSVLLDPARQFMGH